MSVSVYDGPDKTFPRIGMFISSPFWTYPHNMRTFTSSHSSGSLTVEYSGIADIFGPPAFLKGSIFCARFAPEPKVSCDTISFSNLTENSVTLNFRKGDGEGRAVVCHTSKSPIKIPADGIDSNGDPSSGQGDKSNVVYLGNGTSVTVTNLFGKSTYFFSVYEYNGNGDTINFKQSHPAELSLVTPFSGVILSNDTVKVCNGKFYDHGDYYDYSTDTMLIQTLMPSTPGTHLKLDFTKFKLLKMKPDSPNPPDGWEYEPWYPYTIYEDTLEIFDGPDINAPLIGQFKYGFEPTTVVAGNDAGILTVRLRANKYVELPGWEANISCVTVAPEPIDPPSELSFSNLGKTSVTLNFKKEGEGKTIIVATEERTGPRAKPQDSFTYAASNVFGNGSKLTESTFVVYVGTGTVVGITGLKESSKYHFAVLGIGGEGASTNYGQIGGLEGDIKTAYDGILMDDTVSVVCSGEFYDSGGKMYSYAKNENLLKTFKPAVKGNSISVSFREFALDQTESLTIYDGPDTLSPVLKTYSGHPYEGRPGIIEAFNPQGSLTFRFRSHGPNFWPWGWWADISCFPSLIEPAISASAISFSDVTQTSAKLHFKKGDGTKRVVIMKKELPVSVVPFDGQKISGLDESTIKGLEGNRVVYADTGSTVVLNELEIDTKYYFSIFEYNSHENHNYKQSDPALGFIKTLPLAGLALEDTVWKVCDTVIFDPGASRKYAPNLNITETFVPATPGHKLVISLDYLFTDSSGDTLKIFDGPDTNSPLLISTTHYNRSENNVGPLNVFAQNASGILTVNFTSDSVVSPYNWDNGWFGTITCGLMLPEPNLPATNLFTQPLDNSLGFSLSLGDASAALVILHKTEPSLFIPRDRVDATIYNKPPDDNGNHFSLYYANSNYMVFDDLEPDSEYYLTAYPFNGTGFVTNYRQLNPMSAAVRTLRFLNILMSNDTTTVCTGKFYDPGGYGNYAIGENLVHTFYPSSPGAKLKFEFSYLENFNDAQIPELEIFDGPSVNHPPITDIGSGGTPTVVATNDDGAITFRFTSTGSSRGWEALISCLAPLSVESLHGAKQLMVHPNPADNILTISYRPDKRIHPQAPSAEIVTAIGTVVMSKDFEREGRSFDITFDIETLAKGLYFVKVSDCDRIYFKRFIKL
jgi:hypothetical protein